jgi:hypothetical protein
MVNGIKNTFGYWIMVVGRANKFAFKELQIGGLLLTTVIAIIAAVILQLLAKIGFISSNTPIIGEIINNALVQIVITCIAVLIFIVYSLFAIIYIPGLIYTEQQEELLLYKSKSLKISLNGFGFPPNGSPKEEHIFLQVTNNEVKRIIDLEAHLVKLIVYSPGKVGIEENIIFFDLGRLPWNNGKEIISITPENPDSEGWVILAKTNSKKKSLIFSTKAINGEAFKSEVVFGVEVRFKGKLEGETEYRFYTHRDLIYFNPLLERLDCRLAFLEYVKRANQVVTKEYLDLL